MYKIEKYAIAKEALRVVLLISLVAMLIACFTLKGELFGMFALANGVVLIFLLSGIIAFEEKIIKIYENERLSDLCVRISGCDNKIYIAEKNSDKNLEMENNMSNIKFEKVSLEEFQDVWSKCGMRTLGIKNFETYCDKVRDIYNGIKVPKRATIGSAGYDFYIPYDVKIKPGKTIKFPTGIRCKMDRNVVLMLYPRSSLGFNYKFQLDNTVGIIDSDYYDADNEGHIMAKFTNNGDKDLKLKQGHAVMQGIFVNYLTTVDDLTDTRRIGGEGSTDKV